MSKRVWRMEILAGTVRVVVGLLACMQASTGCLRAQDFSTAKLARAAQNPLANIMSVPLQNNTSYAIGPNERTQNALNIQPVVPFAGGRLLTRTVVPMVWQPDMAAQSGHSVGVGDVQLTAIMTRAGGGMTFAGSDDRRDVNRVMIQPMVNYNIGETGWYLSSSPIITADLDADGEQ